MSDKKLTNSKADKPASFVGVVNIPFRAKGKLYLKGDKYDAKDQVSFEALVDKSRIKKIDE